MVKKKQNYKMYWPITVLVAVILLAVIITQIKIPSPAQKQLSQNKTTLKESQTYKSKFLKISFVVPEGFLVNEKDNDVKLESDKGKILMGRIGTNFDTLDEYLTTLSELNHFTLTDKRTIKLKYHETTVGFIDNQEKIYFFYPAQWTVFSISTESQELFNDLDQIADSFHYSP